MINPPEHYFSPIEVTHNGILYEGEVHGTLLKAALQRSDTVITSEDLTEKSEGAVRTGQSAAGKRRRRYLLGALLVGTVATIAAIVVLVTSQNSSPTLASQSVPSYSISSRPSYAPVLLDESGEVDMFDGPDDTISSRPSNAPVLLNENGEVNIFDGPDDTISSRPSNAPVLLDENGEVDIFDGPDDTISSRPSNAPVLLDENGEVNIPDGLDDTISNRPSYAPVPLDENEEVSILGPDEKMLPGEIVSSPNGSYLFEFTNSTGGLKLSTFTGEVLWTVNDDVGATLWMQSDGNLILRTASKSMVWRSKTSQHPDASLRLNNRGRLAVVSSDGITPLWMEGVPGGQYDSASSLSSSLTFPVRGAFYYPWFPETWDVGGVPVFFNPTLGMYSNGDRTVQMAHVEALAYAHVDLAIASWWGPNAKKDRARITNLMDESTQHGIKWTIYHEQERKLQPSVEELQADLAYLKKWFVWHEAWAHIDGKPLVFVWNKGDCDVSDRWMEAANDEWYIVVKKLDRSDCPSQPDNWHQYGPSNAVVHEEGYSFSVSPGFWQANVDTPNLPRLSADEFRSNVIAMVESGEPWQLITTFNEWGEGTAVEPAAEWASPSGYGIYLDALNEIR